MEFVDYVSEIRVSDCFKSNINWQNNDCLIICRHDVISNFFSCCCISLVKFSYWSEFHDVNIITGSGVMTNFVGKRFDQIPRNQKYPAWVLFNIWELGWVRDTNIAKMFPIDSYLMLQNARFTAFTVSELLKEKQQSG